MIVTAEQHQKALEDLARLMDLSPPPGSMAAYTLSRLAQAVEEYESRIFPLPEEDPERFREVACQAEKMTPAPQADTPPSESVIRGESVYHGPLDCSQQLAALRAGMIRAGRLCAQAVATDPPLTSEGAMYQYEKERERLFTDEGQRMLLKIRDNVQRLLRMAGAFEMSHATEGVTGNSWQMLACVDRLVELGELRELTARGTAGQYRVFVAAHL